jgi:deazaflavin-dependent oxidoreductase (nitroreductase family)
MSDQHAPKTYRPNRAMKAANAVMRVLARAGMVPRAVELTVRGRKSGAPHSLPVTPIERGGAVWLVSPYGIVDWVRNLRVAGDLTLSRGRTSRRFTAREATPEEAGPVLKRYVAVAPLVLPYFSAEADDPVDAFVAEADRHPVFELTAIDG